MNTRKKASISFLLGNYEKILTVKTGQTSVKKIILMVRDMIIAGVAKPGFRISYRISIEDAPAAYRECSQRVGYYTKIVIKFKY
jgi:Threonine dehydrogenase and related Zn-dependent dehydrogenases